jgi:ubiquitin-like domain-containing CTD phosphatase 1
MGPLWAEIMSNILPIVNKTRDDEMNMSPPKMALFMGHDTTILPLLISLSTDLWDGKWAPYAAMMNIEVSAVSPASKQSASPAVRI